MRILLAVLMVTLALLQEPAATGAQDVPIEGMDPQKMEILRQVVAAAPDRGDAIQLAMRAVFDDMRRAAKAQGGDQKATPTSALQQVLDRGRGTVQQADRALEQLAKELSVVAKQTAKNLTSCLLEEREHLLELEAALGGQALGCVAEGVRLLGALRRLNETARAVTAEAGRCSKLDDTLVKVQCRSQLLVELGPELLARTAELKEAAAEDAEAVADQVEEHVQKCLPAGSPLDLEVQDLLTDVARCTAASVAAAERRRETPREDL